MNKVSGTALVAIGLLAGVGLTAVGSLVLQNSLQSGQTEPQMMASPVAISHQQVDRLETKNLIFQNLKITPYAGAVPGGSDVAGKLYQVTATITNRSNETMSPSGLSGVTYKLRDSQDRKYQAADFMIGAGVEGLRGTDGILPGQTREGITVGVFDVLPDATGLELGVADGLLADTQYVSPAQPTQATAPSAASASPSSVLVSAPVSPPAPQPAAVQPAAATPAFDSLPPCDQLDAVAKSGKSVAEFVKADWPKYGGVGSICAWHQPQIDVAYRLLNPPAPVRTTAQRSSNSSSGSSGSSTVVIREVPAPRWNNCNGIQEPGESYSARCEAAQEAVDDGTASRRQQRIDNRLRGSDRPANGYSAQ